MSSNISQKTVSIYIDQTAAETALGKLQAKADGFSKKIEDARLKQTALREEITKLEDAGKSTTKLEKQYNSLSKEINNATTKINDNQTAQKKLEDQIAKGISPTLQQQENLVRQLRNELRLLSQDAPEYADKLATFQRASSQLKELKNSIDGVSKSQNEMVNGGSLLTKAGVFFSSFAANMATQVVGAIKNGITAVVQMNSQFESSLHNLSAITGASGKDLDYLKNAAIDMSKQGRQSATDYVEAFKLIASAKPELLDQKENLVSVTQSAKLLADAAGLELPEAATKLTDALNQFGGPAQDAGKYVDALAAAAKYGSAEVPEVTDALLQFGTQAKSSNIDIYESSAAIELLAEKGQKGADAGTKLRNVFLAMSAVDALPKSAVEALAAAGVNTDKLKDKSLSLEERLKELGKIQNNATAIVQVFGKENFNAAQILLQNIPRYAELTSQIKEQGVAENQAATNTNTLSTAWEKFKNVLASRFLDGDNTYLKRLVKDLTETIEPTKSASEQFYELSKNIVHLQTDIVPLTSRYEELQKKAKELGGVTKLTTDDQAEMKSVISQIIEVVPGAATEFDKYGNAIAISTGRVYEFINAETARLKVINGKAIEDYADKLQDVNDKLKNQKIIMDLIAAGKYEISESTSTGGGGYVTESRPAYQSEILVEEKKYQDLLSNQLGIQKEIEKLNGNELSQQLNRANVIKQLEDMLSKLKEGTKEYAILQAEIAKIKGTTVETKVPPPPPDAPDPTADKLQKKQEEIRKNFDAFIKSLDESILNNQIPEHAKPLIAALQKMADETKKLNDIAKPDKTGKPTNITAEQYAEGGKKILLEYKTFLQKFVEDEAKNFKAPINASTIADGQITPSKEQPKIDLPLNINTDVTPEEQKALKEKLDKLQVELDKQAKERENLQTQMKQIKFQEIGEVLNFAQSAAGILSQLYQQQAASEQKALDAELKANDKKKTALDRQLKQRTISQQHYQIEVAQLDAEAENKKAAMEKRQFERTKKAQIAQAMVNGAQAITQIFATVPKVIPGTIIPNPEFPIALAVAIGTNLAEIGVIAKQQYAEGGKVKHPGNGRITTSPNIETMPNGDNILATVRTGEVILNERQQAALGGAETFKRIGVPGFASGGVVQPAYQTRSYQAINFAAATSSIHAARHYASGGAITASGTGTQAAKDPDLLTVVKESKEVNQQLLQTNQLLVSTVGNLADQLSQGITAEVPLRRIEDAQSTKARILQDATFQ